MKKRSIRLAINCDMAEGEGALSKQQIALFSLLSSCNISCGAHAGDSIQIRQTIAAAVNFDLKIGAHPSYPDRLGFGRHRINISRNNLKYSLLSQLFFIKKEVELQNATLSYVKAHGALYNEIADDITLANFFVEIVRSLDMPLAIMGLAGSSLQRIVESKGLSFIAEAFLDRRYNTAGRLLARSHPQSIITDPQQVLQQLLDILQLQRVKPVEGAYLNLTAESFCVHGDHTNTPNILAYLQHKLPSYGYFLDKDKRRTE